nr:uncharacterized protein LOC116156258 [Camelus dromedarius]
MAVCLEILHSLKHFLSLVLKLKLQSPAARNALPHPHPRPRVWKSARDESRDARPGRTHPAGGEAPECLATPPQHAGKEREPREPQGRRRQAGAAQPGCGLQPTSRGQKRSQLRASASPGTQLMAPPPPAGRAPGANPMRLGGAYRSLPGSAGAQPEGQLPAAASVPVLLAVGSSTGYSHPLRNHPHRVRRRRAVRARTVATRKASDIRALGRSAWTATSSRTTPSCEAPTPKILPFLGLTEGATSLVLKMAWSQQGEM